MMLLVSFCSVESRLLKKKRRERGSPQAPVFDVPLAAKPQTTAIVHLGTSVDAWHATDDCSEEAEMESLVSFSHPYLGKSTETKLVPGSRYLSYFSW